MGYVKSSLIPGERVVRWGKIHWYVYLVRAFWWLVAIGIGVSMIIFRATIAQWIRAGAVESGIELPSVRMPMLVAGGGGVWMAATTVKLLLWLIDMKAREYAVTTHRIIMKSGVVRRGTFEVMLRELESISIAQGLRGRLLGFGAVTIGGTGGTSARWTGIADPMLFKKAAESAKMNAMAPGISAAVSSAPPTPFPADDGPGAFDVMGVNKDSGQDAVLRVEAGSSANAKVKGELAGIVVTAVRRAVQPARR